MSYESDAPSRPVPLPEGEEEWAQTYRECGYDYCRPCSTWHPPPECWIDERGVSHLDRVLDADGPE